MVLLELSMSNFKSYENVTINDFHPFINVVIGKNGSGKSNIVEAIAFCLTERYSRLNEAQRLTFIREGKQQATVRITFSNDVSVDPKADLEIQVSRKISIKSDDYFINDKKISQQNYREFLLQHNFYENDFFIVRHSLMSQILNCGSRQLLKQVEKVFGSEAFEKKMTECHENVKTCRSYFDSSEARLLVSTHNLRAIYSPEDFEKFEDFKARRKHLKAKLYSAQTDEYNKQAENIARSIEDAEIFKSAAYENLRKARKVYEIDQQKLNDNKIRLNNLEILYDISNKQLEEYSTGLIKYQNILSRQSPETESENIVIQLEGLNQEISEQQNQINDAMKNFDNIKTGYDSAKKALNEFYKKFARASFAEKIQSDPHYYTPEKIQEMIEYYDKKLKLLVNSSEDAKNTLTELEEKKIEYDNKWKEYIKNFDLIDSEKIQKLKIAILNDELRAFLVYDKICKAVLLCRDINLKISKLRIERSQVSSPHSIINKEIETYLFDPIRVLRRKVLVGDENISPIRTEEAQRDVQDIISNSYLGYVIEYLAENQPMRIAIEALLDSELYSMIVRDNSFTNLIMKYFADEDMDQGFQIISLTDITGEENVIVRDKNVKSLYSILKFTNRDSPFFNDAKRVIKYLCRNKFIVKSPKDCFEYVQKYPNCRFSTKEGVCVRSGGIVTQIKNAVRFDIYSNKKKNDDELLELGEKLQATTQNLQKLEEEHENFIKSKCSNIKELQSSLNILNYFEDTVKIQQEMYSLNELIERVKVFYENLVMKYLEFKNVKSLFVQYSENDYSFYGQDIEPVDNEELGRILKDLSITFKQLSAQKATVHTLKQEILQYFQRKKNLLLKFKQSTDSLMRNNYEKMVEYHENSIEDIQNNIKSTLEEMNKFNSEIITIENKSTKQDYEGAILEYDQIRDEILKKKAAFEQYEELKKTNRSHPDNIEAAQYPRNDFNDKYPEYRNMDQGELLNNLIQIEKKLRKLSTKVRPENKEIIGRAFDTVVDLEKKHCGFTKFTDELEGKIKDVELRKNQTIYLNLGQLRLYLPRFFRLFVPEGTIKIKLLATNKTDSEDSSFPDSPPELVDIFESKIPIDQITNDIQFEQLEISCSFGGDFYVNFDSLSGGQRAVVALSFILSIQKIINIPFSIFDEIEGDLDTAKQQAFVNCIQKVDKMQYLFVSHFETLTRNANHNYLVEYSNSRSNCRKISAEMAIDYIRQNQYDE